MAHSWCLGSQLRLLLCNISFLLLIWTYVSWKLARYHFLSLSLCSLPWKCSYFLFLWAELKPGVWCVTGKERNTRMVRIWFGMCASSCFISWNVHRRCAAIRIYGVVSFLQFLQVSKKIVENHTYYNINIHKIYMIITLININSIGKF